ncbi:MAG TPA: helix-turn-helix transcriptional regulator [Longimicrobiales bacterium]|nr:helix-turn-helix transcriptional regulator [Longimicrobiales bacterium]
MAQAISVSDLAAAADVQRTLLTCPIPSELDRWRLDVNLKIRELVGADRSFLMMPNAAAELCFTDSDYGFRLADDYPRMTEPYWTKYGVWARAAAFGVATRAMLYHPFEREMYRSAYYNEGVVPSRAFDGMSMTLRLGRERRLAQMVVHHERPTGPRFGDREFGLLQVIYPAFAAGVRAYQALERRLTGLATLLDRDGDGVCLFDLDGRLLHANPRAAESLGEGGGLRARIRELVASFRSGRPCRPQTFQASVPTPDGACLARIAFSEPGVIGPDAVAVVLLQKAGARPAADPAELRARFGLTRRQARVATLLADRRTNQEVAQQLSVSVHTVKRHVEQVLLKLGVERREHVERVLRTADATFAPPPAPSPRG